MRALLVASLLVSTALFGVAQAQQPTAPAAPPPVPAAMPFDIPFGAPIDTAQAKQVADAALAELTKRNWKQAVAIVGPTGSLVFFEKADGTQYASTAIALKKARSAATYRRATKYFQDAVQAGHPELMTLPGMIASEGGIPLVVNGKLIGAIGVSGGTGGQDGVAAAAGVAALK